MMARRAAAGVAMVLAGAVAPAPAVATTCSFARVLGTHVFRCTPYSGPESCVYSTAVVEDDNFVYVRVCVPKVIDLPPIPPVPPS